jgi:hypothetical protein
VKKCFVRVKNNLQVSKKPFVSIREFRDEQMALQRAEEYIQRKIIEEKLIRCDSEFELTFSEKDIEEFENPQKRIQPIQFQQTKKAEISSHSQNKSPDSNSRCMSEFEDRLKFSQSKSQARGKRPFLTKRHVPRRQAELKSLSRLGNRYERVSRERFTGRNLPRRGEAQNRPQGLLPERKARRTQDVLERNPHVLEKRQQIRLSQLFRGELA